jgi:hypothetical protein
MRGAGRPKKQPISQLRSLGERGFGLTDKQERFAVIYATKGVTATEAAKAAGYPDGTASVIGNAMLRLDKHANVQRRIMELKNELAKKFEVTFEKHIQKMAEIRDAAMEKGNYASAVAAEKSRGQAAGLYVSRSEILVGKIDQMSKEEVLKEIQKLSKEFPILLEATKPDPDFAIDLKAVREAEPMAEINLNDGRRRVPKYEQDSEDAID